MRSKNVLIVVSLLTLGFVVGRLSVTPSLAASGTLDSPGPPSSTLSYTLDDIYNRLNDGTTGAQSTFTEPASGPTTGTGHTLDEMMSIAPVADNTNGATPAQMLTGKTYWSLRTDGTWGAQTGTMPDRGAVVYTPSTANQSVAAGYHNGSGYVKGDADLVVGNIISSVEVFGVTGTYPWASVPKTGQTLCYDAGGAVISCTGTGQDGGYQAGVTWPSPRFTDNGNGTVSDNLTGLVWLKNANCTSFFSGDSTGQNNRSWSNALTAANSLANGYCGLTDGSSAGDWRLPNAQELQSLIDWGRCCPALPSSHPFTAVQLSNYWSSTTGASSTSSAWNVHLNDGNAYRYLKTNTNYVWPVRGGQYVPRFEGPWESEDNDTYLQANGPLYSGRDYQGYPDDTRDYFSIYLRTSGDITVDLTDHTGSGTQLQLFYQSMDNRVASDLSAPYHIDHTGAAGLYYIYIYTESGHNTTTPYTLRVMHP